MSPCGSPFDPQAELAPGPLLDRVRTLCLTPDPEVRERMIVLAAIFPERASTRA
jgi:hypothetical protein